MTVATLPVNGASIALAAPSKMSILGDWANAAADAARLVRPLVMTDFVPAHFRPDLRSNMTPDERDAAIDLAVCKATGAVLYGAEAGLSPMQSLQGVYVIKGRPAMYARTMLALTLSAGHDVWTVEETDTRVVVCGRRKGSDHEERVTWTIDRAKRSGVFDSNGKYKSEPSAMLLARAHSAICRRIATDALLGMAYSVEELEEDDSQAKNKRSATRKPKAQAPAPDLPGEEPTNLGDAPALASPADLRRLGSAMTSAGVTDRADRLAKAREVVGRDIAAASELTADEVEQVIESLAPAEEVADAIPVEDPPADVEFDASVQPGFVQDGGSR